MPPLIDLTGQRFGRLVVQGRGDNSSNGHVRWLCACDCGGTTLAASYNLKKGHTQSCGCFNRQQSAAAASERHRTHGKTRTPEHRAWSAMFSRCYNPKARGFEYWGGRGIKVCRRWHHFETFLADMGQRPTSAHSLDRIDKNGDYSPGNCRWATPLEQANNRRDNEMVLIDGTEMTLRTALRRAGSVISIDQAKRRIRNGWSHKAAVFTPPLR